MNAKDLLAQARQACDNSVPIPNLEKFKAAVQSLVEALGQGDISEELIEDVERVTDPVEGDYYVVRTFCQAFMITRIKDHRIPCAVVEAESPITAARIYAYKKSD